MNVLLDLETIFLAARSKSELTRFLRALLTPEEIRECRTRWKAFQMSAAGATQRELRKKLGVGLATATRAAKTARQHAEILEMLAHRASKK